MALTNMWQQVFGRKPRRMHEPRYPKARRLLRPAPLAIEFLEDRIVPEGTPWHVALSPDDPANLTLRVSGADLQLVRTDDPNASPFATRALLETSLLEILGADGRAEELTVDLTDSFFALPGGIIFAGGGGEGDRLQVLGAGGAAAYAPDAEALAGSFGLAFGGQATAIQFGGVESVSLRDLDALTVTTPGGADDVAVDSPEPGAMRVAGTSGGTPFASLTALNVPEIVIDAGANDGAGAEDTVTIGGPLPANVTVSTGGGSDTLVGPAADSTWNITGANAGAVGNVSFTGVENLRGAADNEDTFVIHYGGSVEHLFGGTGGFDSLVVEDGTYGTVIATATGPDAGSVSLDGTVIEYAGLEPVIVNTGSADVQVYNLPAEADQLELRHVSGNDFILDSLNGTFEDTTFTFLNSGTSVTINLGGGADTITLKNLAGTSLDNKLTIAGGAGGDTYKLDDGWGTGATLVEGTEPGTTDTLDFGLYGSGAITITPGVSQLTVSSGSNSLKIANGNVTNFESLVGANIDLTGSLASVKTELVDGLKKITDFARDLAASGDFLTDLPLIGKNAEVTISKALDFAEALDEIRFQVEDYFDGLPNLTTQDLIDFLNSKFQPGVDYVGALSHLGAAIFANKPLADADISAADVYDFKLTIDGVVYRVVVDVDAADPTPSYNAATKTVTVGLPNPGSPTVADLLTAINLAIAQVGDLAGQVGAAVRDGRLAFQVVSTEIDELKLAAGSALSAAATKLGLSTTDFVLSNVQDILNGLGDLDVGLASGVTLGVSFVGGTPKLRFDVDYRAERTSEFFYNFGPQAQSLGLAFDLQARIEAMAQLVAEFQLGLGLTGASAVDFFLDVDALRAGVSLTASAVTDAELNLGFIGLEANGSLALEAGIALSPTALATLQNVTNPGAIDAGALGVVLTGGDGTDSPNFDINLALTVDAGTKDIGFTASGTLTAGGNPFDGSSITLNTDTNFQTNFPDFNNLTAAGVVSVLGQLASWLDGVRNGDALASLNIPFVQGGLDKILELGEIVSDALLYDEGPDDIRDGADKLATDLNAALAAAGLEGLLRAQGDGKILKLVAVDPKVSSFSIALNPDDAGGFAQLGFSPGSSSGTPKAITGGTPTSVVGQLTGIAGFKVTVTREGEVTSYDVSLKAEDTTDNKGIGDDVAKLLDVSNAPTFKNTQEFADRLSQILTLGLVNYDVASKVLTLKISFADRKLFGVELPTDFKLDLSPIGNIVSDTRLFIDAKGGINLTLGFDLSTNPSGSSALTLGSTLADDGDKLTVDVKKEEAVTGDGAPRAIVGQLSGDATFTITYNPTVTVTVPALSGRPGTDVNVSQRAGEQSESTIAVNPVNPNNIIIGANDIPAVVDTVWVSTNGGTSWTPKVIPSPAAGTAVGDPSLVFARDGSRVVYTHMLEKTPGGDTVIVSAVSLNGGATWNPADTAVIGSLAADEDGDGVNDSNDKNWIAVGPDPSDPTQDLFVVTWQRHNVIYVSTSPDGLTWSAPVVVGGLNEALSTGDPGPGGSSIDAIPSFGPNGEIYVTWEDFGTVGFSQIKFDVSLDGGVTWGNGRDTRVEFLTASAALDSTDKAVLNQVAAALLGDPKLVATIAGYTDTVGNDADNLTLSVDRATAVFNYLKNDKLVPESQMVVLGFGETHLAVATGNDVDSQANRRVEITFDSIIYTGNVNVFNDQFNGGLGLDATDETTSPAGQGEYEIPAQPTRGIWMGLSMAVDRSGGPHDGRIYIAFADQGDRDGDPDAANAADHRDTDLFVLASDNGGLTWTALGANPIKVNDDTGINSQFFSWLDVDQSTGNVAVSWYDTRNDSTGTADDATQYFSSFSTDGGVTWRSNVQVSDGTSATATANGYGDYSGLAFVNGTIYMTWADNSGSVPGSLSTEIYFDKIDLTNHTFQDLLDDINFAFAHATVPDGGDAGSDPDPFPINTKFLARETLPGSNILEIVATDSTITSFTIAVISNADPAFRDLGLQPSTPSADSGGQPVVRGAKPVPALVGQLTADASFAIDLDGAGSGAPVTVTVPRADTVSSFAPNRNILDLVNDVQKAVNLALGAGVISVSSTSDRLVFTRTGTPVLGTVDQFTITPGANASELGLLSTLTSNEADFIITTSNGVKHAIRLDGAQTIQDVIDAINNQTGGAVTAALTVDDPEGDPTPVNEANTGLTLLDNTSGSAMFEVAPTNGSAAAIKLGIVGMDKNPNDPDDVADKKIVGAKIAGATLLDRFFITSDTLSSVLNATLDVQAGIVLSNITITNEAAGITTITALGYDFIKLNAQDVTDGKVKIRIKGVAGLTEGEYTITEVVNKTTVKLSGDFGSVNQTGGAGVLLTGVKAAANFGFVGITLGGTADLGAKLTLGFNSNHAALSDSKLTLQELVDNLGNVLDLLTPPDIQTRPGETNFGTVDLKVGLTAAGGDLSGLASTLFGTDPRVELTIVTLGDPFIDTRFRQASYEQIDATHFRVNGDFTGKLPSSVTLRFNLGGTDIDFTVTSALFASGKTTVTVMPVTSGSLPASLTDVDVTLLPKVTADQFDLGDLPDFSNLSFDQIIAALQALVSFLGTFDQLSFLNSKIPVINKSVNDLLSFTSDLASAIEEARANPAGSLQLLEAKLNEAIGISSARLTELFNIVGLPVVPGLTDDVIDLSFDPATDILKFDLSLGTSFSQGLDLAIPGIDFGSALAALGLGNLIDLSGGAGLRAEGAILLRLTLGVDIDNITDLASITDHLFIYDTTGVTAKLKIGGEDIAFRIGVGPFSLSVAGTPTDPSEVEITGSATLGVNVPVGEEKVALSAVLSNPGGSFTGGLTGAITGNLPVYFPTDASRLGAIRIGGSNGAGAFTTNGSLANIFNGGFDIKSSSSETLTPNAIVVDVSDVVQGISNFNLGDFNLFDNIFLAVDGIDSVLGFLEDTVGGQLGSLTIPLIGGGLSKAAGFITDLREDFIAPLRAGIEKAKNAAQDFADADKNIISKLIFDILGPAGANLLKPLDGSYSPSDDDSPADFISLATNLDAYLFGPAATRPALKDVFIEWNLALGDELVNSGADIGFDLGIPGLGLKTEGDVNLVVEWLLNLGFGLNAQDGFYLKVDDGLDSTPPVPELAFDVSVTLPAAITGTLGFLGLRAQDKTIDGKNTQLGATFAVDVFERNATSAADRAKLGFTEFGQIGLNPGIAADASASLGMELGLSPDLLGDLFGSGANSVISGFPKVVGDFVFRWEVGTRGSGTTLMQRVNNPSTQFVALFPSINALDQNVFLGTGIGNAIQDGLKKVAIQDIGLDVGSFLSDVLGPLVQEVSKFTKPIQPLIDFVTSPIPIIGQLGLNITWLDLAQALAGDKINVGLIRSVAEIITLINDIASISSVGSVVLPIGNLTLYDIANANTAAIKLWDSSFKLGSKFDQVTNPASGLIQDAITAAGGIDNALGALAGGLNTNPQAQKTVNTLKNAANGTAAGGFSFPFLNDPSQIFGLLMGKDATLVAYDLAPLNFGFDFHQFFPIFGPLGVSIGLLVDFKVDTAFGYDTRGIRQFVEGGFNNPLLLFNGFFINDSPKQNGVDDPELTFLAELQAAAELNLGIARAGVAAAFGFKILFDLFDPDKDGKIRITELIGNITNQLKAPSDAEKLLAPLAIFDVRGEIFARLFAFLEINLGFFSFKKEFPIFGPVTLLSFDVDFFRPPILASEQANGDLIIHAGKYADQRLLGNATDVAENFIIESNGTDGDYVKVRIRSADGAVGEDADVFQDYRVKTGRKIIIDGGQADDTFTLTNFTEPNVQFDIDLGVGNDKLFWGAAGATGVAGTFNTIRGGKGDDTLNGSGASDLILGDAGNDTINAYGGDDLIFGDEAEIGTSTVTGLVKPSDGRDTIDAGDGRDIVFGGGAKDDIKGGAMADLLMGGGGLVTFTSSTAFKVFGNVEPLSAGGVAKVENPTLDSTAGDTIDGQGGDDLVFGTAGPDILKGGTGKDTIFGMAGFDDIDGGDDDDTIFGDSGKITAAGLVPGDGGEADSIQGGKGNDTIFGGGGGDLIKGGDGNDLIHGGSGPDVIFGDNGTVDPVTKVPLAAEGPGDGDDIIFGEGEPDKILGGGGLDRIDGGLGNDSVLGGSGGDLIIANKGSDNLNGQEGGDTYIIDYQGGDAASLMQVIDDGSTGTDIFVANGTIFDDRILLRANAAGTLAFVALINSQFRVERINYIGVERIFVNGSFGNDYIASDDTTAEVTVNGDFGDDTFQIGQMFKSQRGDMTDAVAPFNFSDVTGISFEDAFADIETTRGFLSNGISAPMVINGGEGNDNFTVFHNKAVLQLNGENGDDVFTIRAFALAGSQEPQRERTDITGGDGADLVQYVVNAPVNIDGGDGFDTVVIIGTEFGDDFVVTDSGVFGAGLNVNFVNIESLRVDGAEGDDRFFVKSTSEKFITELFGGLGSDTFNMSGDTPPVVSNDLLGHSGLILHSVESTDDRFGEKKLFGISANVADNDEPFAVIRQTGGSTIVTEGDAAGDSYEIVLTRAPDPGMVVEITVLAPVPTPTARELGSQRFRISSPTALVDAANNQPSTDGTALVLRFTAANWFTPQTVFVFADATTVFDVNTLFTRPELVGNPDPPPPAIPFKMDDDAYEGVHFGVINHLVRARPAAAPNDPKGLLQAVDNAAPSATIAEPAGITPSSLVGRTLVISGGDGTGQIRTILAVQDLGASLKLTLDRPFIGTIPTTTSTYLIQLDDAIVGKVSSFTEDAFVASDPDDHRSIFVDSTANYPTAGEGLTGSVLEIIGGPGAGQQRLILGHVSGSATTQLILNGGWGIDPVAEQSTYRIKRFAGLALPSITVQVNDNDLPGLIIDETFGVKSGDATVNNSDLVADFDTITSVIEGGNGDQRGEIDVLRVRLSTNPGADTIEIRLVYDATQLQLTDASGNVLNASTLLSFTSADWNAFQSVFVRALADGVREGFHTSLVSFEIVGGADTTGNQTDTFKSVPADQPVYFVGLTHTPKAGSVSVTLNGVSLVEGTGFFIAGNKIVFLAAGDPTPVSGDISVSYQYAKPGFASAFTAPVVVRISDAEAPTVLVRETGGSTDVAEGSSATDSYELVLTAKPTDTVTVTVKPEVTKTTRTGGIRHDDIQVAVSSGDARATLNADGTITVVFGTADGNWDKPVVITVTAINDGVVDGSDTQVFAPGPNTVSGILGPVTVEGAGGRGTLAINAPLMLPGELNVRKSDGNVVSFMPAAPDAAGTPGVVEQMVVETADLEAKRVAFGLASINELLGLTIEMSKGKGVGLVLDPAFPREQFDRFWMITALETVAGTGGVQTRLFLQNPSQLNVAALNPSDAYPDANSEYAITALSANFFVDERSQVDFMFVHDEDSPADSAGVLTPTQITGLNMGPDLVIGGKSRPGGITYGDLEVLEINLGYGNNNFTVLGTPTRADGYQTWTFLNTGDDLVFNGVEGDTVTVKLNAADSVTATGGITAASNPTLATGFKTTATIPGTFADGALAGQLIRILADGLGNTNADNQVRRIIGNVGGLLTLDLPWEVVPTGEAFQIVNPADGAFAVNAEGGNDTIDASASSLGIVMFGGDGSDNLTGGTGDDIIFGDRGRVDYFNESGAIVTRLGDAPAPILGKVTTQVTLATLMTLVESGASFPLPDTLADGLGTDDIGLAGLFVDVNSGKGFLQTIKLLTGNTATSLTLAAPGFDPNLDLPGPDGANTSEYRISTRPENQTDGVVRDPGLLITVDNTIGGTDVINSGAGNDKVFGGAGDDEIHAGSGDDLVVGDAGRLDLTPDPALPAGPVVFVPGGSQPIVAHTFADRLRTIAFATGGADTITGDEGNDTILGGAAGDTISGNDGADLIVGDNGEVNYTSGVIDNVFTTDTASATGGIDTIHGNAGADIILGGVTGDAITGDADPDVILGDNGRVNFTGGVVAHIFTNDAGEALGGPDTISGGTANDIILGGVNNGSPDVLSGNEGDDIILGDDGELIYDDPAHPELTTLDIVRTTDVSLGGADTIYGNAGKDLVFAGAGGDRVEGGTEDDIVFGDFAEARLLANKIDVVESIDLTQGGADVIFGNEQDDLLVGGAAGDFIDGDQNSDLIFGDAVKLLRRDGIKTNPRFQALAGTRIYTRTDLDGGDPDASGQVLVDDVARNYRNTDGSAAPAWAEYQILNLYHSAVLEVNPDGSFGNDYIAGGQGDDQIFGQLGNDTIQGDGGIESAVGANTVLYGASRAAGTDLPLTPSLTVTSAGVLSLTHSFETDLDGDDYIEGNGGNDVIFGNLGRDDIFGGSSELFTLNSRDLRPDGADIIFGGSGQRIDAGVQVGSGDVFVDARHARDADTILGDNGNIFRLVGVDHTEGGGFLTFAYDITALNAAALNDGLAGGYSATVRLIPRAAELLDYTPGGPDFRPDLFALPATADIGGADEVHGESGDDAIYGMTGGDRLYGDSEDDDIIGGWGADWISGGAGQDGVLGDDGRIFTSRNSTTGEALYGVAGLLASDPDSRASNGNVLNEVIYTPGQIQTATINLTGYLKKAVDLTPFNLKPNAQGADDPLFEPQSANDIIYGGLGSDWLHGGAGDDAVSGAEAVGRFYTEPTNPGNVLRFGSFSRAGEFIDYDEFNPLTRLDPFLLNFNTADGPAVAAGSAIHTDGNDAIFGDLGNDWVVGGTGRDDMYGGWGNDLLDADDDKGTNGGLNDTPDTAASYEDRGYGGAGRDVLLANTGGDRLIDWVGEFNTYVVPFAPFGAAAISRTVQPQLPEFLYALSLGDGIDPTRVADTGGAAARNAEPDGELGLVLQHDFAWQDQTGAPIDPQAGNIPGGRRDVLRSADFNAGGSPQSAGFFADSGKWEIQGGALQVAADSTRGDAVSVYAAGAYLPSYFELQATIEPIKPTAGWKANAYVIYDYFSPTDFKFAGIDIALNKVVIGHKASWGWAVDASTNMQLKPDTFYNMLVAINGTNVTVLVDGAKSFSYTFPPRVIDGLSYGLNQGMIGFGSDSARGSYDNIAVRVLPPQLTFQHTEAFDDGVANLFTVPVVGNWSLPVAGGNGRYVGAPAAGGDRAVSLVDLGVRSLKTESYLELSATLSTQATGGLIFDQNGSDIFKYVALDVQAGKVVIGHHTSKGWFVDKSVARTLTAGTDYTLGVAIKGTTVSVTLGGSVVLGRSFNGVAVDGGFGLLSKGGSSSFDSVTIKTDDAAFAIGMPMFAEELADGAPVGSVLTEVLLAPVLDEAVRRWLALGGDAATLAAVSVAVADLPGLYLGQTHGPAIYLDLDSAGYEWFIDPTPRDDSEFTLAGDQGEQRRMDLLTVVMHELGHVLGYANGGTGVMSEALAAGTRLAPTTAPIVPAGPAGPVEADWAVRMVAGGFLAPQAGRAAVVGGAVLPPVDQGKPVGPIWTHPTPTTGDEAAILLAPSTERRPTPWALLVESDDDLTFWCVALGD